MTNNNVAKPYLRFPIITFRYFLQIATDVSSSNIKETSEAICENCKN